MYVFDTGADRRNTDSVKWDRFRTQNHLTDVIPMSGADMDFDCGDFILDALRRRTEHPIFGYTDPPAGLMQAIVDWNRRRYGCEVDPESICFSTGVVYSIVTAVQFFTEKTDKVVVQTPAYPPFFRKPAALGRTVVENPLVRSADGDWYFDYDALEALLAADSAVRLLLLCNPHNPVGRCWTAEELTRLLTICAAYNVMVLSDEIHADFVLPGRRHCSVLGLNSALLNNVVVCASPTKSFNLAGLKTSYAVVPDPGFKRRFQDALKLTGTSSINIYGFAAMEAAYTKGDRWLDACVGYINQNLDLVGEFFCARLPLVRYRKPEGTYLAWLDFNPMGVDPGLNYNLLYKAGVELIDGANFGAPGAGFQRLNVACPRDTLWEGLDRIARYLA